jgi:hypothetical protein
VSARRALAALIVVSALLAGCTSDAPTVLPRSPSGSPSATPSRTGAPAASVALLGQSAARAAAKLCPSRPPAGSEVPAEGPAPPIVSSVERRVEGIRGLRFTTRVPVDAVTHAELVRGLRQTFDAAYPARMFERRSLAWATIGAIPAGTQIRQQLESFASTQVIGYYDEVSKYLVFLGTNDPTPSQVVTLAHELTHALDDQHFGLLRLDQLAGRCDDEGFEAALALTEGDATYVMVAYARKYLSIEEQLALGQGSGSAADIDPFILRLESWPYTAGLSFVQSLVDRGGERAVDAAFRRLPATTEQIMDPSAYPNDAPVTVDVRQLAPALGRGWRDLDVQATGAAWLSTLLGLRIDQTRANAAVGGWEGGLYRAWTNGTDAAVVLRTSWQDDAAASRFASAMRDWISAGSRLAQVLPAGGSHVTVLFASSAGVLSSLRSAV